MIGSAARNMTSASDIITYVGVPLAVLGVLPVFYTFINSFFTLRNIRHSLRRCGLEATTRGSFMAGVIEVSLARFSITPLERTEEDYWTQNMKPSILKGGTWTIFHWNQLITGHAQQRIQYSSDLRVPQAEIELEELFEFLLDRGAVPDAKGIHMLRISGLWTPTGTCLMLSPDGTQCVLRVSVPDESDGILSLALHWIPKWDIRDPSTLPPGWMRIALPPPAPSDMTEKGSEIETQRAVSEKPDSNPPDKGPSPSTDSTHDQKPPSYQPPATSLRYRLTSQPESPYLKTTSPVYEYMSKPLPSTPSNPPPSINPWFAPLSLILALSQRLPLYTHQIPPTLHNLPTPIPSGVLEILGLVHASEIPEWETKHDRSPEIWAQHQRSVLTSPLPLPPLPNNLSI